MWTLLKLLALGTVIALAILLPFAFLMSHLLLRAPPDLGALGRRFFGNDSIPDPSPSFSVLAFGFIIIYNIFSWIFSWLPESSLVQLFNVGDFRLDWALPAFAIAWAMLKFAERQVGRR
jgi:hypothetical protein